MATTDARPVPRKNTAFRVTFPILDNDGDPVSAAAGLDSEVSLDGAAFADCTNEATEIGTSGFYFLDLIAAEMNADTVVVQIKTSTLNAKTAPIIFYPAASTELPASTTIASAIMASVVEGTRTVQQAFRLMLAALAGKVSGASGTSIIIRDTDDSKDRIQATVDFNGNRTSVTYDLS